MLGPDQSEKK